MQAGRLNRRCQLQSPSQSVDELGQPIPGWTDVATVWAVAARVRSLTALAETLTPLPMVAAAAAELEHPLAPVHRSCMGQQAGFFTPEGK